VVLPGKYGGRELEGGGSPIYWAIVPDESGNYKIRRARFFPFSSFLSSGLRVRMTRSEGLAMTLKTRGAAF